LHAARQDKRDTLAELLGDVVPALVDTSERRGAALAYNLFVGGGAASDGENVGDSAGSGGGMLANGSTLVAGYYAAVPSDAPTQLLLKLLKQVRRRCTHTHDMTFVSL
jgi:hypothetical protein